MQRYIGALLGSMAIVALGVSPLRSQIMFSILADVPASQHFQGPGDVVTFTAWWGLRAMNAAVALAGTQTVADLRRGSDNATCTFKVAANGGVDLTTGTVCNSNTQTVFAWMTRGTFTGAAISGTSLTFSGLSGSASSGDRIVGTGVAADTKISGSCTVSPCTVDISQTVASTTITDLIPTFASKAYDQTAGNACGGSSCDVLQATGSRQPEFIMNCNGTLPCLQIVGSGTTNNLIGANNFTPSGTSHSMAGVANRISGTSALGIIISSNSSNRLQTTGTANSWNMTSNITISGTANDNSWHNATGVINNNPGTSTLKIDGSASTNTTATVNTGAGKPKFPESASFATITMRVSEAGFTNSVGWNSTQETALCHNMRVYWSTGGSC